MKIHLHIASVGFCFFFGNTFWLTRDISKRFVSLPSALNYVPNGVQHNCIISFKNHTILMLSCNRNFCAPADLCKVTWMCFMSLLQHSLAGWRYLHQLNWRFGLHPFNHVISLDIVAFLAINSMWVRGNAGLWYMGRSFNSACHPHEHKLDQSAPLILFAIIKLIFSKTGSKLHSELDHPWDVVRAGICGSPARLWWWLSCQFRKQKEIRIKKTFENWMHKDSHSLSSRYFM